MEVPQAAGGWWGGPGAQSWQTLGHCDDLRSHSPSQRPLPQVWQAVVAEATPALQARAGDQGDSTRGRGLLPWPGVSLAARVTDGCCSLPAPQPHWAWGPACPPAQGPDPKGPSPPSAAPSPRDPGIRTSSPAAGPASATPSCFPVRRAHDRSSTPEPGGTLRPRCALLRHGPPRCCHVPRPPPAGGGHSAGLCKPKA